MKIKKYSNLCFILIAAVFLLLPAFLTNCKPNQISTAENRALAELVPLSRGYSAFMKSIDACANDRIGLRDEMVSLYNEITVNCLHTRNDQVIFGKDGWLFFREDLNDYTGQNNNNSRVEYYVKVLKAVDEWCKANDSQFVFMVGPNKSSVYHKYMPDYIKRADESLLDALSARCKQEGILFVNPKKALIENSEDVELYYKLDTHWNAYGAKYALDDLLSQLNLPEKDIPVSEYRENSGDLLAMLSVESVGSDSLYVNVEMNSDCNIEKVPNTNHRFLRTMNGESFYCYRDSFSTALENYYGYYFDGPMYWHWDIQQTPEGAFPKYVIVECVERYMMRAINNCASILDAN